MHELTPRADFIRRRADILNDRAADVESFLCASEEVAKRYLRERGIDCRDGEVLASPDPERDPPIKCEFRWPTLDLEGLAIADFYRDVIRSLEIMLAVYKSELAGLPDAVKLIEERRAEVRG